MINYYQQKTFISNSDLTALQKALNLEAERPGTQETYDFGNLIDSLITEPENVDLANKVLNLSSGGRVTFTEEQWLKAMKMRENAFKHDLVMPIMSSMESQFIKREKMFVIEYNEFKFSLPVKVKLDGIKHRTLTGADLKTTACTSLKSAIASLDMWDYDRQAAWYMDICGLDRFWFFFLSKTPNRRGQHEIFVHAVQRGDDVYNAGRAKYQRLAFKYYTLVHCLNPTLVNLSLNYAA